jgi:hypothetical protein
VTARSAAIDERRPLPASAAVLELARAALIRTGRGRALWVVVALVALPTVMAIVLAGAGPGLDERSWNQVYLLCHLMLVVVPPVLVASAVADEVEDKTAAYLWSRALPRWTVIAGKLLALAPLCALLVGGAPVLAWYAGGLGSVMDVGWLVNGALGLAAAAAVGAMLAAAIATLVPRHAVAVSVGWMVLIDGPLGALDVRLHHLSVGYGARAIAGFGDVTIASGAITLAVLAVIFTAIACWRVGKLE